MRQHLRIHKAEPNKGILDYSHLLDAPAGKHGFVETRNGHLYFEDGKRARFLGFNVAARSNTPVMKLRKNGRAFCKHGSKPDSSSCSRCACR